MPAEIIQRASGLKRRRNRPATRFQRGSPAGARGSAVMKWYLVERIGRCHTEHEPMPPDVTGDGRSATMSHSKQPIRVPLMTTPNRTTT
jgi:hypothetical protein